MDLSPEHQQALAQCPAALRELIEAELAAGNAIVGISHSHPAPPVGAAFKLARQVSTRPRASSAELSFYERSSSSHSGEFTDAQRFFWVLEPPNEPPPEADMDAIRRALSQPSDALSFSPVAPTPRKRSSPAAPRARGTGAGWPAPAASRRRIPEGARTSTNLDHGVRHELHFRDDRPPHDVQAELERRLRVVLTGRLVDGTLRYTGVAELTGAHCAFELVFVAAAAQGHRYHLSMQARWSPSDTDQHEHYRRHAGSWFDLWTQGFAPARPGASASKASKRYRQCCDEAFAAEARLGSVAAIQQAIIAGLAKGGRFSRSSKEDSTRIVWFQGRFHRIEEGDQPRHDTYTDQADFLQMLRGFCSMQVRSRYGPAEPAELDEWRLILRCMSP